MNIFGQVEFPRQWVLCVMVAFDVEHTDSAITKAVQLTSQVCCCSCAALGTVKKVACYQKRVDALGNGGVDDAGER